MSADRTIRELSTVVLRRSVESEGHVQPEGSQGTVVYAWDDGKHYLVEFGDEDEPTHVIDVEREDF
jgi:Domain of unknown function (DUF4926)